MNEVTLFWFRRDLRIQDNTGLYHALKSGTPVVPVFIFDRNILDELEDSNDRRVEFIHLALQEIQSALIEKDTTLDIRYGKPLDVFREFILDYRITAVYTNSDYEPYARERDTAVASLLRKNNIEFLSFKDHVIFEKDEIIKDDGRPYSVFTPYSRKWNSKLNADSFRIQHNEKYFNRFQKQSARRMISLTEMGFKSAGQAFPSKSLNKELIKKYKELRDFPSLMGTS
ncbi:MAG: deoxyribodipyrimidine photo-lyase, partial [Chitinophagaceae bacterium]